MLAAVLPTYEEIRLSAALSAGTSVVWTAVASPLLRSVMVCCRAVITLTPVAVSERKPSVVPLPATMLV